MSWFVYVLRCRGNTLYTGVAADPVRRYRQHLAGPRAGGAKYTAAHKPEAMLALWEAPDKSAALRLEARIKGLTRPEKLALVNGGELEGYRRVPVPEGNEI